MNMTRAATEVQLEINHASKCLLPHSTLLLVPHLFVEYRAEGAYPHLFKAQLMYSASPSNSP